MPMLRSAFVLLAILAPALCQDAPTADALLQRAIALDKAQAARGAKYTFREDEERFPTDKNGKPQPPSRRTYENIMLEGDNYRKLVAIDGKPPDAKTQKKIDAAMEKARAERRAHPEIKKHEIRIGGLDQLVKMYDSKLVGEEMVSERKAWRIEATPKPDYRPANEEERRQLALRRTVWIDEQEGVAFKFLETFLKEAGGFEPGSEIETDLAKHDDDWLLDRLILRYKAKIMVVHMYGESRNRYYDYKRFQAESRIVE